MADLNSSPSNEKPNLDVLFPELKKTDTALPAPRFMAPAAAAATLLKGVPPSARAVPPPPSLRSPKPASVRPAPPSARAVRSVPEEIAEEVHAEELIASAPMNLEPIRPVDDDDDESVDDGPTVAMASPLPSVPRLSQPVASAPRAPIPTPPPSRRAAPPPSAAKLPPLPSAPQLARPSAPSATKLPPVPTPPPSLRNVAPPSAPTANPLPPVYTEAEVESMTQPPARAKSTRASAAASLAAASGASTAYVPPSVIPPASRPVSPLETIQATRAHSLIPTAASVPPPALEAPRKSRAGLVAALAVASLGLLGGLGFAAVKGGSALGLGAPATGSVAITAAGPGGARVDGLRVLVDGAVKCDSAPCKLANLSAGTHFVSAEAPGYATTAARAISVERGGDAALHIDLSPTAPLVAAAPAAAAKPEAQATPVAELKAEEAAPRAQPAVAKADKSAKTDKAEKKDAKKDDAKKAVAEDAAGQGTLNINSIPVANVVLDGRPVGSTPLVGLKVSPGPHSVVFIHPEQGRKSAGATVKAGATSTVAVRF